MAKKSVSPKIFTIVECPESQGFFIGDECITVNMRSDADWREEYFEPITKALGIQVEYIDIDDAIEDQRREISEIDPQDEYEDEDDSEEDDDFEE